MYKIIINYENKEIVIGDITTKHTSRKLLNGKITKEINSVSSFEFDIALDNIGYNYLFPLKTQIRVFNTLTNRNVFEGRILKESDLLEEDGRVYKTFKAEDKLGYLIDSPQIYGEYNSLNEAIDVLLNMHNAYVEEWKRIYKGEVLDINLNGEKVILTYDNSLENIKNILSLYGGEVIIRTEGDKNYLDYKDVIGVYSNTEIKLGVNLKQFSSDIDPTEYYSIAVPFGKKLKVLASDGSEVESEERINISSINNNEIYVIDKELESKIGKVSKILEYDDEEDKNVLKNNAINFLRQQKLNISNDLTALDLSKLGFNYDDFRIGNFYKIDVPFFNVNYYVRAIGESIDINNPHLSSLSFGDKIIDIKDYQLEIKKENKEYKSIKNQVEIASKKVNDISSSMSSTTNKINLLEQSLTGYIDSETYNTFIQNLNQTLQDIENRLSILEGGGANG